MESIEDKDLANEYKGRFEWRTGENLQRMHRLYDLTGNAGGGGQKMYEAYKQLKWIQVDGTPEEALSISLFHAWNEVCECFIFGEYQAVILLCRSVAERSLKMQYIKAKGALPAGGWTLGKVIIECAGIVDQNIIDLAKALKEPGNDRAHANLEMNAPEVANRGGEKRGVQVVGGHYQIYPFEGEAEFAIEKAHLILKGLYS